MKAPEHFADPFLRKLSIFYIESELFILLLTSYFLSAL